MVLLSAYLTIALYCRGDQEDRDPWKVLFSAYLTIALYCRGDQEDRDPWKVLFSAYLTIGIVGVTRKTETHGRFYSRPISP